MPAIKISWHPRRQCFVGKMTWEQLLAMVYGDIEAAHFIARNSALIDLTGEVTLYIVYLPPSAING